MCIHLFLIFIYRFFRNIETHCQRDLFVTKSKCALCDTISDPILITYWFIQFCYRIFYALILDGNKAAFWSAHWLTDLSSGVYLILCGASQQQPSFKHQLSVTKQQQPSFTHQLSVTKQQAVWWNSRDPSSSRKAVWKMFEIQWKGLCRLCNIIELIIIVFVFLSPEQLNFIIINDTEHPVTKTNEDIKIYSNLFNLYHTFHCETNIDNCNVRAHIFSYKLWITDIN